MTAPYYDADGVTLYLGDCLEQTAWLTADVLITDPPYGMAFRSNKYRPGEKFDRIAGDHDAALRDAALDLWDVANADWMSGEPAPAAVFGTWKVDRPTAVHTLLIWEKRSSCGMGDLTVPFGPNHEEIYLRGPWVKPDTFRRRGSVLATAEHPQKTTERVGHPTPKPVGLMEILVSATPAGVSIADPFAGGGSTLIAARNLGRKAIGVELEERYCEIIARRLDQGALELGV